MLLRLDKRLDIGDIRLGHLGKPRISFLGVTFNTASTDLLAASVEAVQVTRKLGEPSTKRKLYSLRNHCNSVLERDSG